MVRIADKFWQAGNWVVFGSKIKTFSLALVVALKKKSRLFTIFPDFTSIFQTFSRSEKLLDKFQDFFKNSRLCTNPGGQIGSR